MYSRLDTGTQLGIAGYYIEHGGNLGIVGTSGKTNAMTFV
jgi:hypothetical protein